MKTEVKYKPERLGKRGSVIAMPTISCKYVCFLDSYALISCLTPFTRN
jgi:hypothetical protein